MRRSYEYSRVHLLCQEAQELSQMDHTPQGPSDKSLEEQIIMKLYERFGRLPTERELFQFIFGDDWTQFVIWNKEKVGCKCTIGTQET